MITKVREKKKKHVWSVQIMSELLKHASMYEYEHTGASPQALVHSHKEDGDTKPYEIVEDEEATFASVINQPVNPSTSTENPLNLSGKKDNGKVKDDLIMLYSP